MGYEEIALFDLGGVDEEVEMPRLPRRVSRRRYSAAAKDRCDYCVLVAHQRAGCAAAGIRTPVWRRTGVDGAVLLLCAGHDELLLSASTQEVGGR
jgi:hypothetical protein